MVNYVMEAFERFCMYFRFEYDIVYIVNFLYEAVFYVATSTNKKKSCILKGTAAACSKIGQPSNLDFPFYYTFP